VIFDAWIFSSAWAVISIAPSDWMMTFWSPWSRAMLALPFDVERRTTSLSSSQNSRKWPVR